MFRHEIAKILKEAFALVIEETMIKKLIIVTAMFFTQL